MDTSLRLASLTAFYFSVTVATSAPTTPAAMDKVSRRAYRDLGCTLQSLYRFTEGLDGVDSQDEFDLPSRRVVPGTNRLLTEHPRDDRAFISTYAHAQK